MFLFKNRISDERGKILSISAAMPSVFAYLYASRTYHISLQKIAQFKLKSKNKVYRKPSIGRLL